MNSINNTTTNNRLAAMPIYFSVSIAKRCKQVTSQLVTSPDGRVDVSASFSWDVGRQRFDPAMSEYVESPL